MATQRPRCIECGRLMPSEDAGRVSEDGTRFYRSTAIDLIDKWGMFCTLRCAAKHGVRAAEKRLGL